MHGVETFCLALRQVQHARGNDREACRLEPAIDLADEIGFHAVGLDDGQGALERHSAGPYRRLSNGCGCSHRHATPVRGQAAKSTLGDAPAAIWRAMEVPVW